MTVDRRIQDVINLINSALWVAGNSGNRVSRIVSSPLRETRIVSFFSLLLLLSFFLRHSTCCVRIPRAQ